jgi:hypothetical protein
METLQLLKLQLVLGVTPQLIQGVIQQVAMASPQEVHNFQRML